MPVRFADFCQFWQNINWINILNVEISTSVSNDIYKVVDYLLFCYCSKCFLPIIFCFSKTTSSVFLSSLGHMVIFKIRQASNIILSSNISNLIEWLSIFSANSTEALLKASQDFLNYSNSVIFRWSTHLCMSLFPSLCLSCTISQEQPYII